MASEKNYTIPLRSQTLKTGRHKRAKRAVSAVRQFMKKHARAAQVKLGRHLNMKLWERGMRGVPHRIRVRAESDGKSAVRVELVGAPREVKKKPEKKAVTPAEKIAEKVRELKPGNKEITAKSDAKTGQKTGKAPETKQEKKETPAVKPEPVTETGGKPETKPEKAGEGTAQKKPAEPAEKKQPDAPDGK